MKKAFWFVLFALSTTLQLAADPLQDHVPREEITCEDVWGAC